MGSQGSGSNGIGSGRARVQAQCPNSNPNRKGSFYGLTLDEVQSELGELGKPVGTVNLDELFKTLCSAEVTGDQDAVGVGYEPSLDQQPGDLSEKNVDEVWRNIQEEKRGGLDRKLTLEDFLVKAGVGVVVESSHGKNSSESVVDPMGLPQQTYNPVPSIHPPQQQVMLPVFVPENPVQQSVSVAYPEAQVAMSASPMMGDLSDSRRARQKRAVSGNVGARGIESWQKRMIKNRESAARSRARKQAYTHELESKVSMLEQENARLKKLKAFVMTLLPPQHQPTFQLRRASSGPL